MTHPVFLRRRGHADSPIVASFLLFLIFSTISAANPLTSHELNVYSRYPHAVAPMAIRLVCSADYTQLTAHFVAERLPFDHAAVRREDGEHCHIAYEPTARGFRAHTEDAPVRGFYVDVPQLRLLTPPMPPIGDSLDILKAVLAQAPRSLDVSLGTGLNISPAAARQAMARHFPDSRHRVDLRVTPQTEINAWAQDFIKSGVRGNRPALIAPRRSFEGDPKITTGYKAQLDALEAGGTIRSKLTWEGGDLLFVRSPKNPERLVLLHGHAARVYWGEKLSEPEYSYLLRREFGADESLNLGGVAPHVDYVVSFLPGERVALLARPVTGDLELARAAVRQLRMAFDPKSAPVLAELAVALGDPRVLRSKESKKLRKLLKKARHSFKEWSMPVNAEVFRQIQAMIDQHCPGDAMECTGARLLPDLLTRQSRLLSEWVQMASALKMGELLPAAMLNVVEDQLPGETDQREKRLREIARDLEKHGFRVIRVPWVGGRTDGIDPWAGISYANLVAIDRRLFVPIFGLGEAEQSLVESIIPQLPPGWVIVPVYARSALLQSGGVHCALGLVRDAGSGRDVDNHTAVSE